MANISDKVQQIRQAVYGKDVRESIASGIEAINSEVETTTAKQARLETTFEQLIINAGNSNAEIVDARGGFDTLRKKLDSYAINVKDFGAEGDGVTDDTAAIQAAATHVNQYGGILFFPLGTYLISEPIVITKPGVYVHGVNSGWGDDVISSTVKAKDGFVGTALFIFQGQLYGTIYSRSVGMRNMNLNCNGQLCHGIYGESVYDGSMWENIIITKVHPDYNAIRIRGFPDRICQTIVMNNVFGFHDPNLQPTVAGEGLYADYWQECTLINCKFESRGAAAVLLKNSSDITLLNCSFTGDITGYGLDVYSSDARGRNIHVINSTFESPATAVRVRYNQQQLNGTGFTCKVGDIIYQGAVSGRVIVASSTMLYVADVTGGWFTTGAVTDVNSNVVGTVTSVSFRQMAGFKLDNPRVLSPAQQTWVVDLQGTIGAIIELKRPSGPSSSTWQVNVGQNCSNTDILCDQPYTINNNGTNTHIREIGFPIMLRTSQLPQNYYLPKAYIGREVYILYDTPGKLQYIWCITGDTFDGTNIQLTYYGGGQYIKFKCFVDGIWTVTDSDGPYTINDQIKDNPVIGIRNDVIHASSSIQVSEKHNGATFTNKNATGWISCNLPSSRPGLTYTFIRISPYTMQIAPKPTDIIRGASAAGKYAILSADGDNVTLRCVTPGYWEIVASKGNITFQA